MEGQGKEERGRWLLLATGAAYALIGIEILVMISPFALYFYSVYGPLLTSFAASPLTSWSTEFFLPHMVFVADPLIRALSFLQVLLVVGGLLFLSAALPLYWGRFTGKAVVSGGFYRLVRHPQYLFLALSGFGLLIYWPRFIILILYITMLFVYYLLARNEEWRMEREAPGRYADYRRHTPMFLPGEPGGKLYRLLFAWIRPRWFGIFVVYLCSLILAGGVALGVRSYTVSHLGAVRQDGVTLLTVYPRPAEEVAALYRQATAAERGRALGSSLPSYNLVYLMPADYFLTALVTAADRRFSPETLASFPEVGEWLRHKFNGGLGKFFRIFANFLFRLADRDPAAEVERLLFVRVTDQNGNLVAAENIFQMGGRRTPLFFVDLDPGRQEVVAAEPTASQHKWGTMPMPTF